MAGVAVVAGPASCRPRVRMPNSASGVIAIRCLKIFSLLEVCARRKSFERRRIRTFGGRDLGVAMLDVACELAQARPLAEAACRAILGNAEDAEDCVSQAIEAALASPIELNDARAWLLTVSRRRAIDLLRRRQLERRRPPCAAPAASDAECHYDEILDTHEARWLGQQVHRLPRTTCRVFKRFVEGDSVVDIAQVTGLSKRSVESHLLRARRQLKTAWARTLGWTLTGLIALRRLCHHGSTETAQMASFALVGAIVFAGVSAGPDDSRGARAVISLTSRAATPLLRARAPQTHPWERQGHRPPSPPPPHSGHGARRARVAPSVTVVTPVSRSSVSEKDRGGGSDPVSTVTGCLDNFEVSDAHIGC